MHRSRQKWKYYFKSLEKTSITQFFGFVSPFSIFKRFTLNRLDTGEWKERSCNISTWRIISKIYDVGKLIYVTFSIWKWRNENSLWHDLKETTKLNKIVFLCLYLKQRMGPLNVSLAITILANVEKRFSYK
jgi:hypothetical protein